MVAKQDPIDFICLRCKHFRHYKSYSPLFKCKAFHDGIPKLIVNGNSQHTSPFKDQGNKLIFELKE